MSKISSIGRYSHIALISCIQLFMILSISHGCGNPFYVCPVPTSPTAPAFQSNLRSLLSILQESAPASTALVYNASTGRGRDQVYGLAMCKGNDVTAATCSACLHDLNNDILLRCPGRSEAFMSCHLCSIHYGNWSLFVTVDSRPPREGLGPLPLPGTEQKKTPGLARNLLSAFLGGSSVSLVIIIGCFLYCILQRKKAAKERKDAEAMLRELGLRSYPNDTSEVNIEEDFSSAGLPMVDLATLIHATNNFSSGTKLGEGGFGPVYKGVMRDGREIAIKRLSKSSGQGLREFKNEIILIAKLQHKNLVRLLNCCVEGGELLLVYESLANKSLDVFLFDSTKRVELDWQRRLDIIHGIARGLQYLHEDSRLKIIHRDLKASNILLDHEMNPKISDFGMARIF